MVVLDIGEMLMKLEKLFDPFEALEACDERHRKWHKWFAWRPVPCDGIYYWLKSVERKGRSSGWSNIDGGYHTGWIWAYRKCGEKMFNLRKEEK